MIQSRWLLLGMVLAGCAEKPPVLDAPVKPAKSLQAEDDSQLNSKAGPRDSYEAVVGGFRFIVPGDWSEQPLKSEVTLGDYSIPGEAGPARLTISPARGGIEKISRSVGAGQFSQGPKDEDPRESAITFDGKTGTLLELHGTFTDMFVNREARKDSTNAGCCHSPGGNNVFHQDDWPFVDCDRSS